MTESDPTFVSSKHIAEDHDLYRRGELARAAAAMDKAADDHTHAAATLGTAPEVWALASRHFDVSEECRRIARTWRKQVTTDYTRIGRTNPNIPRNDDGESFRLAAEAAKQTGDLHLAIVFMDKAESWYLRLGDVLEQNGVSDEEVAPIWDKARQCEITALTWADEYISLHAPGEETL